MRTIHIISHPREQLEVKGCRQRRANGVEMSQRVFQFTHQSGGVRYPW